MRTLPFAPAAEPAIIVPLMGRDAAELSAQAGTAAAEAGVDVLEWRADALPAGDGQRDAASAEAADALRAGFEAVASPGLPVLVTFRSEAEGGECPLEAYHARVAAALRLCAPRDDRSGQADRSGQGAGAAAQAEHAGDREDIGVRAEQAGRAGQGVRRRPAAVDVEIAREGASGLITAARDAGVSAVASSHFWERTPSLGELAERFGAMASAGADVAKIAVMPHALEDVLRLMQATHAAAENLGIPVIGIAMGELGRLTRLAGAEFGSAGTFATVGEGSAPGQMTAAQLAVVRQALRR